MTDCFTDFPVRSKPFDLLDGRTLFGGQDVQPELARFDRREGDFKIGAQRGAGQESFPSRAVAVLQFVVLHAARPRCFMKAAR